MLRKSQDIPSVMFSVRVYRQLLRAYPTKFQLAYGQDMAQVFQDCCLRTVSQNGINGMAKLWVRTFFDLIQSVISEHSQKEIEMKKEMKPEDIHLAGVALVVGGIALALSVVAGAQGENGWYIITTILSFICMPLLAMGMLGLRSRYGNQVGAFGTNVLLIGAILGPITGIVGFILQNVSELWTLIFTGPITLFVCLIVFGLIGLYKKPLPHWNVLPIFAGLWLTIRWLPIVIPTLPWSADDSLGVVDVVFGILQVAALVALGYILKSDVSENTMAAV